MCPIDTVGVGLINRADHEWVVRATRWWWLVAGVACAGCAQPNHIDSRSMSPDAPAGRVQVTIDPRTDPVAYLRQVHARCASLDQYTLTFMREERRGLGLFNSMRGPERIRCWFRRDPFSVRMLWLDPDVKYGESSYVAGRDDDQVRFVPRHGLFGLRPGITRVNVRTPVRWGEARYPLTDFGLQRSMERVIDAVEAAGPDAEVRYLGRVSEGDPPIEAHRIRVTVPGRFSVTPTSELNVDTQTHLLIATRLFSVTGRLEAAYTYHDLDTSVALTDDDFLMNAEREPRTARAGSVERHPASVGD